ncbi:MAG: FAD:protein FMN transferase [Vulcanimicrobiota bacterium]
MVHQARFKAMGTTIEVSLYSLDPAQAQAALSLAPGLFEELEQEFSRFRPDSGLCRLNAGAGQGAQKVSPLLAEVCALALAFAEESAGLFDPTVLRALEDAGYDTSFQEVALRADPGPPRRALEARPRWREVKIEGDSILLPGDTSLDLGGIAKGWAADYVAERLRPYGPAMVNAGGDVRATGRLNDEELWGIALADPHYPTATCLPSSSRTAAITTSGVGDVPLVDGQRMHHSIDPRTQRPFQSDAHTVTVLGASAAECEVASKVALLLGIHEGASYLTHLGLEGILTAYDGRSISVGDRFELEG